jgi:hypothetical protein
VDLYHRSITKLPDFCLMSLTDGPLYLNLGTRKMRWKFSNVRPTALAMKSLNLSDQVPVRPYDHTRENSAPKSVVGRWDSVFLHVALNELQVEFKTASYCWGEPDQHVWFNVLMMKYSRITRSVSPCFPSKTSGTRLRRRNIT